MLINASSSTTHSVSQSRHNACIFCVCVIFKLLYSSQSNWSTARLTKTVD